MDFIEVQPLTYLARSSDVCLIHDGTEYVVTVLLQPRTRPEIWQDVWSGQDVAEAVLTYWTERRSPSI